MSEHPMMKDFAETRRSKPNRRVWGRHDGAYFIEENTRRAEYKLYMPSKVAPGSTLIAMRRSLNGVLDEYQRHSDGGRDMSPREIYAGPFTYDPWAQMIFIPDTPHLVAQVNGIIDKESAFLTIRGWGGLSTSLGDALARQVQDAFGQRVAALLNEHGIGDEVKKLLRTAGQGGEG